MSRSSSDAPVFIVMALISGPNLLFWALKRLYKKRQIENTPTSKIRSAAMGMVEFSGIARQKKPLIAPLSNLRCCWWWCQVQELRRSGKNSHWATVKTVGSIDFFYLDDMTGHVLVNPIGAEISVMNTTHDINSSTRPKLSPLLSSWGVDSSGWFGFEKRMRILEETLPESAPVYVIGELSLMRDQLKDRQMRFRERLRLLKSNPGAMKNADSNQDGSVSSDEWDAFRIKQEEAFLESEMAKDAGTTQEEQMVVQAPAHGTYIISAGTEADVLGKMSWMVPLALVGGLALSAGGVYMANLQHWSPLFIVGLLLAGMVFGRWIKLKGAIQWH